MVYYNGAWGSVCDDFFESGQIAGHVACRGMGFRTKISDTNSSGSSTYGKNRFGNTTVIFHRLSAHRLSALGKFM